MRLLGNCWSSHQYFAKMTFLMHLLGKLNRRRKLSLIAIVNHVKTITQKINQHFICTKNWGMTAAAT